MCKQERLGSAVEKALAKSRLRRRGREAGALSINGYMLWLEEECFRLEREAQRPAQEEGDDGGTLP